MAMAVPMLLKAANAMKNKVGPMMNAMSSSNDKKPPEDKTDETLQILDDKMKAFIEGHLKEVFSHQLNFNHIFTDIQKLINSPEITNEIKVSYLGTVKDTFEDVIREYMFRIDDYNTQLTFFAFFIKQPSIINLFKDLINKR